MNSDDGSSCLGRSGIGVKARREPDCVAIVVFGPQGHLHEARFGMKDLSQWAEELSRYLVQHPPMRGAETAAFQIDGPSRHTLRVVDLGLASPRILLELSAVGKWWQEAKFDEADFVGWLKELGTYLRSS